MDEILSKTLLVWAAFAVVFGPLLTRGSLRHSPIHGGIVAHGFHFLGAMAIVGVIPAVLTALILGGGFRLAFPLALTMVLSSLASLVLFAIAEKPALQAVQAAKRDEGWTEEDARSSGL